MTSRHPAPEKRGVSRSSRTLGAGCGGRFWCIRRTHRRRTAKPCGPDAPTLASSWRQCLRIAAYDGDNKARSPGRARNKPLKPLRRKRRNVWPTCGDLLACFLLLHARLRVRLAPGVSCALEFLGGDAWQSSGSHAARTRTRGPSRVTAHPSRRARARSSGRGPE
jgi:hypothetical protein